MLVRLLFGQCQSRRIRRHDLSRRQMREHTSIPNDLIYPVFVLDCRNATGLRRYKRNWDLILCNHDQAACMYPDDRRGK